MLVDPGVSARPLDMFVLRADASNSSRMARRRRPAIVCHQARRSRQGGRARALRTARERLSLGVDGASQPSSRCDVGLSAIRPLGSASRRVRKPSASAVCPTAASASPAGHDKCQTGAKSARCPASRSNPRISATNSAHLSERSVLLVADGKPCASDRALRRWNQPPRPISRHRWYPLSITHGRCRDRACARRHDVAQRRVSVDRHDEQAARSSGRAPPPPRPQ